MNKDTDTEKAMLESIKNIAVIKTFNAENRSRNNWERMYINSLSNASKYIMLGSISNSAVMAMRTLTIAVMIGYGSLLALQNTISIGEALAFSMIAMLTLLPLGNLMQIYNELNTAQFYASGLNKVYAIDTEFDSREQKKPPLNVQSPSIEFKNLSFSYQDKGVPILNNLELSIPGGSYTAIYGKMGSGKSTIIHLLTRMTNPLSGKIFIDQHDIQQVNLSSLRRCIGVAFQQPFLFSGTIKDNISYGNPDATLAQVIEAATLVGAHEFIIKMSKGYDTVLGEDGMGLSGGQKRLVAIARALVSNPPILILDEPTNDFDIETEQVFKENLKTIGFGRTLIIITHKASLIRDADHIALIDQGRLIEFGNHNSLLANKGYYFYLTAKQLNVL
jgi:ABC-type bacteriocin/lantibiotic exporter with double-glycine peptidase domain